MKKPRQGPNFTLNQETTSKSLRSPTLRATFTHDITYYPHVKRLKIAGHANRHLEKAAVFPLEAVPFVKPISAKKRLVNHLERKPLPL